MDQTTSIPVSTAQPVSVPDAAISNIPVQAMSDQTAAVPATPSQLTPDQPPSEQPAPAQAPLTTLLSNIQNGTLSVEPSLLVDGKRLPNKFLSEFVTEYLKVNNNNYQDALEQLLALDALAESGKLPE